MPSLVSQASIMSGVKVAQEIENNACQHNQVSSTTRPGGGDPGWRGPCPAGPAAAVRAGTEARVAGTAEAVARRHEAAAGGQARGAHRRNQRGAEAQRCAAETVGSRGAAAAGELRRASTGPPAIPGSDGAAAPAGCGSRLGPARSSPPGSQA